MVVGRRIVSRQTEVWETPWCPAGSMARFSDVHRITCAPTPVTGMRAEDPAYKRVRARSTRQEMPAIPDGLPPAVALRYWVPAVEGAPERPEILTHGCVL